jgi:hypothetical protein
MYWISNECGTLNCLWQILTEYKDEDLPLVLEACERMHAHLTAAVVSNDVLFLQVMKISLFPVLTQCTYKMQCGLNMYLCRTNLERLLDILR